MGSSRPPDRSLGTGLSLPQWMKGKMDTKLDLDDNAFSPPSHDDSFFYIRYPKRQEPSAPTAPQGFRAINEVLHDNTMTMASNKTNDKPPTAAATTTSELKKVSEIDFSKHPLPCQPFIPTANNQVNEMRPPKTVVAGKIKPKSQGTDDGFHSEPALCGKSIVHVANQMMSNKLHKSNNNNNNGVSESSTAAAIMRTEKMEMEPKKGSKSLPVTPIASPSTSPDSSPKARRRLHTNRYFTGTFVPDRDKYQSGWILASILGHSREIVSAKIEEEDESTVLEIPSQPPHRVLSRKKSISSQNLTYIGKDDKPTETPPSLIQTTTHVFKAKPSELREMNFWSPTSM